MIREEKKIIRTQVCDICRVEESYKKCSGCGIDICPDCEDDEDKVRHYRHSIHVTGSGDGLYCNECQEILRENKDEKFAAYSKMDQLITNHEKYMEAFRSEALKLEKEILKHGT